MAGASEIKIKGQVELERAFLELRKEVLVELKPMIAGLAEVVRVDAQSRAGAEIANIGPRWQRMRVGVTLRGAYVAPKSKRTSGSPRRNLAGELMDSMQGALDSKRAFIERGFEELVTVSAAKNGFY
jgi:hypothetical protein